MVCHCCAIQAQTNYDIVINTTEAYQVNLYVESIEGLKSESGWRLPNGNTLIDFGNLQADETVSVVVEVTPENEVVFQLEYDNGGNLYRAHKFDWFFTTLRLSLL